MKCDNCRYRKMCYRRYNPIGDKYSHTDNCEHYEEYKERPHWIPCSERLPEENKTVIASTKRGVFPEAMYTKEDGWAWAFESGADYWEELDGVIAWMPLPEPYKKEGEQND